MGANTIDCILNFLTFNAFTRGIENASVFPEPVFACPTTSLPSKIGGKDFSCIDVKVEKPNVSRFFLNSIGISKSFKFEINYP